MVPGLGPDSARPGSARHRQRPHRRPRRRRPMRHRRACGSMASTCRRSSMPGSTSIPMRPNNGLNFGQLFTDHANQATINQLLLTANKPLDPKNSDFQWGFKLQGMYGSDARYTQYLGELNNVAAGRSLSVRRGRSERPVPPAVPDRWRRRPEGRSVSDTARIRNDRSIDQSVLLALLHLPVRSAVQAHRRADDRSMSTTCWMSTAVWIPAPTRPLGPLGENNSAIGGIAGFNLTLMGGNLTILALTHIGPEQARPRVPSSPGRLQCRRLLALTTTTS